MCSDKPLTRELMQQTVGEVVEIMQPLAYVGLGLPLQFGARVVLHAFDRRFRRQSGRHRFAQPPQPAPVMREEPECFQHIAMFSWTHVAAVDQEIERSAHGTNRGIEPFNFLL